MNETETSPSEKNLSEIDLASELAAFNGLSEILKDQEIKKQFYELAASEGFPSWLSILFYRTLIFSAGRAESFLGDAFASRLQAFADRWPTISNILQTIINLKHGEKNKGRLKTELLTALKEMRQANISEIAFDEATGLETLISLYNSEGFSRLGDQMDTQTKTFVDVLQKEIESKFRDFNELFQTERGPALFIPEKQNEKSNTTRHRRHRLHYTSNVNHFIGRKRELAWLNEFSGYPGECDPTMMFRWMVLTGQGGLGKTRLAFHFVEQELKSTVWDRGFLSYEQLVRFLSEAEKWRPRTPMFMVVDYARNVSKEVGSLLRKLSRMQRSFEFPVRLLLLERSTGSDWSDELIPFDTIGIEVERTCHRPHSPVLSSTTTNQSDSNFAWEILPFSKEDIIKLMLQRFKYENVPAPNEDVLFDAANKLDSVGRSSVSASNSAPRPLFAAAAADEFIFHYKETGSWPESIVPEKIMQAIVNRDRQLWWKPAASGNDTTRHEYALALATLVQGLDLTDLRTKDRVFGDAARWLPDAPPDHDEKICAAMGGGGDFLPGLEPDLLGEFFVLEQVKKLSSREPHNDKIRFLSGSIEIGKVSASVVLSRIIQDFPDRIEELNVSELVKVANKDTAGPLAILLLILASQTPGHTDWHFIESELSALDSLREVSDDGRDIATVEAQIVFQIARAAGNAWHWNIVALMHDRFEALRRIFGPYRKLDFYEAEALVNLANQARPVEDERKRADLLRRVDRLREQYSDDQDFAQTETEATFNVLRISALSENWEVVEQMLSRLARIRCKYSDNHQIALSEAKAAILCASRTNKKGERNWVEQIFNRLDELHQIFRDDPEISVCDAKTQVNITSRAGMAGDWDRVDGALTRLDKLRQSLKEDRDIAYEDARAAFNVVNHAARAGKYALVSKMILRMDKIRCAFANDREIAKEVIKAAITVSLFASNEKLLLESLIENLTSISTRFGASISVTENNVNVHTAESLLFELKKKIN